MTIDPTCDVWDDEDGRCYVEGHHVPLDVIIAVNAYVDSTGARSFLDERNLGYKVVDVEHVWFVQDPDDEDRLLKAWATTPGAKPHSVVPVSTTS